MMSVGECGGRAGGRELQSAEIGGEGFAEC